MGRRKGKQVDWIALFGDALKLWQQGGKQQNRTLSKLTKSSKEISLKVKKMVKSLPKSDLPPQMKAMIKSLDETVQDDMKLIQEWVRKDKQMSKFLVLIPIIKPVTLLLLGPISIYLSQLNIGYTPLIFTIAIMIGLVFFCRSQVEDGVAAWSGTHEIQYKEMQTRFKGYGQRMKEFEETQNQLRESRAFDVSKILKDYPDAKKFWINQFGFDTQVVPTTQFIEVLLDWRNRLDLSRGIKVAPLPEKERETVYLTIEDIIDANKDGNIAPTELANVLSYFGPLHQTVPKMTCLVDTDKDDEPIRSSWFVWTDVGSKEIEQKIVKSDYFPCFVVRASESHLSNFALTLAKIEKRGSSATSYKFLIENSHQMVSSWGQATIRRWLQDRAVLMPNDKEYTEEEIDSMEMAVDLYFINNPDKLFPSTKIQGKDTKQKLSEVFAEPDWHLVRFDDLQSFSEHLERKQREKMEKLISSFAPEDAKAYLDFKMFNFETEMKGLRRNLVNLANATDSEQKSTGEWETTVKARFSTLYRYVEGEKEYDYIFNGLKKFHELFYDKELDFDYTEDPTDVVEKDALVLSTALPPQDIRQSFDDFLSQVESVLRRMVLKKEVRKVRAEILSESKLCNELAKPLDTIFNMTKDVSRLLSRIEWITEIEASDWACRTFSKRNPFAVLFMDVCNVEEIMHEAEKVVMDQGMKFFLVNTFETGTSYEEGEIDKKIKMVAAEIKSILSSPEFAKKFPKPKSEPWEVTLNDLRNYLMIKGMNSQTRAVFREAMYRVAKPIVNQSPIFRDVLKLQQMLEDKKLQKKFLNLLDDASQTKYANSADANALLSEVKTKLNALQEEILHPADWTVENAISYVTKTLVGKMYPGLLTQLQQSYKDSALAYIKRSSKEKDSALAYIKRTLNYLGVDGNALLMLPRKKINPFLRPPTSAGEGKEIKSPKRVRAGSAWLRTAESAAKNCMISSQTWEFLEAAMYKSQESLRLDLRLGYHFKPSAKKQKKMREDRKRSSSKSPRGKNRKRKPSFFYPNLAEYVEQEYMKKMPKLKPWSDPEVSVEFNVRGTMVKCHIRRFFMNERTRNTKLAHDIECFLPRVIQERLFYDHDPEAFRVILNWYLHDCWMFIEDEISPSLIREVAMDLFVDRSTEFKQGDIVVLTTKEAGDKRWNATYEIAKLLGKRRCELTPVIVTAKSAEERNVLNSSTYIQDGDYKYRVTPIASSGPLISKFEDIGKYHKYHVDALSLLRDQGRWREAAAERARKTAMQAEVEAKEEERRIQREAKKAKIQKSKSNEAGAKKKKAKENMYSAFVIEDEEFEVGEEVKYYSENVKKWFSGKVIQAKDGKYSIRLRAGQVRTVKDKSRLKKVQQPEMFVGGDDSSSEGGEIIEISSPQGKDGYATIDHNIMDTETEAVEIKAPMSTQGAESPVESPPAPSAYDTPEAPDAPSTSAYDTLENPKVEFKVGQKVCYHSKSTGKWLLSTVAEVSGRITVMVGDSGVRRTATADRLRDFPWKEGDEILYKSKTRLQWFKGIVVKIEKECKVKVRLHSGIEKTAEFDQIKMADKVSEEVEVFRGAYNKEERKRYDRVNRYDMKDSNEMQSSKYDTPDNEDFNRQSEKNNYDPLRESAFDDKEKEKGTIYGETSEEMVKIETVPLETASNYNAMESEDFEKKITLPVKKKIEKLEDLIDQDGAYYPDFDRTKAIHLIKTKLGEFKDCDYVYLFRTTRSRQPTAPDEKVFVLSFGQRVSGRDKFSHFIMYFRKSEGVRFEAGAEIKESLEQFRTVENMNDFLGEALDWKSYKPAV